MAGRSKEPKEPPNVVHQNAILCETINKQKRHQKLYVNFFMNPYKKLHIITGKPNSPFDLQDDVEDSNFVRVIERAQQEPTQKYDRPQTEAQEIGWLTTPLIDNDKSDRRLNFHRIGTEVTAFADTPWKDKDQENAK